MHETVMLHQTCRPYVSNRACKHALCTCSVLCVRSISYLHYVNAYTYACIVYALHTVLYIHTYILLNIFYHWTIIIQCSILILHTTWLLVKDIYYCMDWPLIVMPDDMINLKYSVVEYHDDTYFISKHFISSKFV